MVMLCVNLYAAARSTQLSHSLQRPWPDLPTSFALPWPLGVAFLACLAAAYAVPAPAAQYFSIGAGGFGGALALQGLAVAHALSRGLKMGRSCWSRFTLAACSGPNTCFRFSRDSALSTCFQAARTRSPRSRPYPDGTQIGDDHGRDLTGARWCTGTHGRYSPVKDGYARDFPLPRGKALRATEANKKKFEARRAEREARTTKPSAAQTRSRRS